MNNISFTSRIRLVNNVEFNREIASIGEKYSVKSPWTTRETVHARSAYTNYVYDCTAFGLTDGLKVFLMHICPTERENFPFSKIKKFVGEHIDLTDKNLQGFILGGKYGNLNSPKSIPLFEKLEKIFIKNNIPYSSFKGGDYTNNISYNSNKDEWLIYNELMDNSYFTSIGNPRYIMKKIFRDIKIADCDELTII